jgi:hypothetical protein
MPDVGRECDLMRKHRLDVLFYALCAFNFVFGAVLPDHLKSWWLVFVALFAFAAGTVNGILWEGDRRGW